MSFAKLDGDITESSLWSQPEHVRVVWIAFLAKKDEHGFVHASYTGMQRVSNLKNDESGEKFKSAIECLESPDPDSKTKAFDGRRIQRVDGGWIVLNHELYRLKESVKKEQTRLRVRKYRENQRLGICVTHCNAGNALHALHSKSVSVSESGKEGGGGGEKQLTPEEIAGMPDYVRNYLRGVYEQMQKTFGDEFPEYAKQFLNTIKGLEKK